MKKLFAILLAVAMIMSFALTASADENKTYTANLMYCDGDGDDMAFPADSVTVTGSGTYTLTYDASVSTTGAWGGFMLYVQIDGAYADLKDWIVSDIKVSVDGEALDVKQNVAYVHPINDLGKDSTPDYSVYVYYSTISTTDYIIELVNNYAGFSAQHGTAFDPGFVWNYDTEGWDETWRARESISVTFTLTDPADVEETEPTKTEEKDDKDDKDDKGDTDATTKPTSKPDSSNAQTGDASSLFVALMAVSAMGIVVIAKKKH